MILVTDDGQLTNVWPYVREELRSGLEGFDVRFVNVQQTPIATLDLEEVEALAWFGGDLRPEDIWRAPNLKAVGAVTDAQGMSSMAAMLARGIPLIDVTRAWAPSVAEFGVALTLSALRRIPYWHHRLIMEPGYDWNFIPVQMTDDPSFTNGDLGGKSVGVIGIGAIGGRVVQLCNAFGAAVKAFDPYAPVPRFHELGTVSVDLDSLMDWSEILVVAVPPTPSALGIVNRDRVDRLRKGAIVVTISRAAALDTEALRRRVLDGELVWAADVFDIEPLPAGDPILGLDNVVHAPHIAGRTRDTNLRVGRLIAADFRRVLAGEDPVCVLTADAVELRTGLRPEPVSSQTPGPRPTSP